MRLASVKPGDIIECDVKGLRFLAWVQERGPKLRIKPHSPNITYREVGARQVKAHWHRASRNGNGRSQLAAPIE